MMTGSDTTSDIVKIIDLLPGVYDNDDKACEALSLLLSDSELSVSKDDLDLFNQNKVHERLLLEAKWELIYQFYLRGFFSSVIPQLRDLYRLAIEKTEGSSALLEAFSAFDLFRLHHVISELYIRETPHLTSATMNGWVQAFPTIFNRDLGDKRFADIDLSEEELNSLKLALNLWPGQKHELLSALDEQTLIELIDLFDDGASKTGKGERLSNLMESLSLIVTKDDLINFILLQHPTIKKMCMQPDALHDLDKTLNDLIEKLETIENPRLCANSVVPRMVHESEVTVSLDKVKLAYKLVHRVGDEVFGLIIEAVRLYTENSDNLRYKALLSIALKTAIDEVIEGKASDDLLNYLKGECTELDNAILLSNHLESVQDRFNTIVLRRLVQEPYHSTDELNFEPSRFPAAKSFMLECFARHASRIINMNQTIKGLVRFSNDDDALSASLFSYLLMVNDYQMLAELIDLVAKGEITLNKLDKETYQGAINHRPQIQIHLRLLQPESTSAYNQATNAFGKRFVETMLSGMLHFPKKTKDLLNALNQAFRNDNLPLAYNIWHHIHDYNAKHKRPHKILLSTEDRVAILHSLIDNSRLDEALTFWIVEFRHVKFDELKDQDEFTSHINDSGFIPLFKHMLVVGCLNFNNVGKRSVLTIRTNAVTQISYTVSKSSLLYITATDDSDKYIDAAVEAAASDGRVSKSGHGVFTPRLVGDKQETSIEHADLGASNGCG